MSWPEYAQISLIFPALAGTVFAMVWVPFRWAWDGFLFPQPKKK